MARQIYASYDQTGIYVYQAFKPSTVKAALAKGTFGEGFRLNRMTWIKPSFGWMLYRSGYATKPGQEAILKIKLSHEGWLAILEQGIETSFNLHIYPDKQAWKQALENADVRFQWDPDRFLDGRKRKCRALQVGIKGQVIQRYVDEWIIGLQEVTDLAHAIKAALDNDEPLPHVPEETRYEVGEHLAKRLGIE